MLTEHDKERIFQREMYRREIREQVEKVETVKKGMGRDPWSFLNSPFFLWILSSVLLGITSFLYAHWDKQRTLEQEQREKATLTERENKAVARKLDAELSSRLIYFVNSIKYAHTSTSKSALIISAYIPAKVEQAVIGLEDPTTINYKVNVFPEYANRSLRSLLLELQSVVPDNEKQEIDVAYKKSIILQSIYLSSVDIKQGQLKAFLEEKQSKELQLLDEAFNLKRWGEPFSSATYNQYIPELLERHRQSKLK